MKIINMKTLIALLIVMSCFSINLIAQNSMETSGALSEKQQALIPIVAYTASGNLQKLKPVLNNGLDVGWTVNEINEAMIHLYAYAGFPRSIRGLQTFMEVVDEREAEGIDDEQGPEASPINANQSKYERGTDILVELTGAPPEAFRRGYAAFAPTIEVFLKEHLFADIFERDVLSYDQRQLVTISVLSSLDGLEPMLGGHMNISMNVGLEPDQLQHFVSIIESTLGKVKGEAAQNVLDQVLENRNSD